MTTPLALPAPSPRPSTYWVMAPTALSRDHASDPRRDGGLTQLTSATSEPAALDELVTTLRALADAARAPVAGALVEAADALEELSLQLAASRREVLESAWAAERQSARYASLQASR